MIDYKSELNEEQLRVVLQGDGASLVLAGAGSGKTRTVTFRVAYLLEQGIDPNNILLVTFTNKASREMISRVESLCHGKVRLPWAGTFHHIGYRILAQYAGLLGYKQNFTILDSEDSKDLLKLCLKEDGGERTERKFPSVAVIHSILSFTRNAERPLQEILEEKYPQWADYAETFARIASEYDKKKKAANVMDFDDLLLNLRNLLQNLEPIRRKFATQFQYVMVDEYQDTNKIQASIIDLFASVHKNILVVGDDAQSIYSFRAASISNILDFEKKYTDAKVFRLETNYRSTPEILDLANAVIKNNINQYEKELRSVKKSGVRPQLQAYADNREEGEAVAQKILELIEEGTPLHEIAVLFRASHHSQALEVELTKRNIAYDYRGGTRFFERAHIKDVLAFLRAFNNLEDTIAWSRILTMQAGIGPGAAEKIIFEIKRIGGEMIDLSSIAEILTARAKIGFKDFLSIWRNLEATDKSPAGLISAVLDSNYKTYLENEYPDYRDRENDIEQLALFAEKETDLSKFLADAGLQENYTRPQEGRSAQEDKEKIILSTIHQAKGLEWEAVFILNVSAGQFPSDRALSEEKGLEEERRLFYVAITRARNYLHMSYPLVSALSYGVLGGPSMFLQEIDANLVEGSSLSGNSFFKDLDDEDEGITYVSEDDSFGTAQDEPFASKPFGVTQGKPRPKSFLKSIDEL
jgi:DNA helicase-2/ATP-dependent DNA helicase PcrA